jgi:transketolase
MAAANYGLDNLLPIIDRNGLQISGTTEQVMALEDFHAQWAAFGWDVSKRTGTICRRCCAYFHGEHPTVNRTA